MISFCSRVARVIASLGRARAVPHRRTGVRLHAAARMTCGATALGILVAALGCGADGLVTSEGPLLIALTVDSVLNVGAATAPTVTASIKNRDGSAFSLETTAFVAFSSSDTSVLKILDGNVGSHDVPLQPQKEGVVTLTATVNESHTSIRIHVVDNRPVVAAQLGASYTSPAPYGVGTTRYAFDLRAGDTIDLRIVGADLAQVSGPALSLNRTFTEPTTFAAVVVPQTALYVFSGEIGASCSRGVCNYGSGPFTLTVRRGGPVFTVSNPTSSFALSGASDVVDTLWIRNVGAGTLTVRAATTYAFLTPDAVVVARAGERVPLVTRVNGSATPLGGLEASVSVSMDTAVVWHPAYLFQGNTFSHFLTLRAYDAQIRVLRFQYFNAITAVSPDLLYAVDGGALYSVQVATGTITQLPVASHDYRWVGTQLDGTVLVGFGGVVAKVQPDKTLLTLLSGNTFALSPDGTVFAWKNDTLSKRSPGGVVTTIRAGAGEPMRNTMAYSARDNSLYYTRGGVLYRLDVATSNEIAVAATPNFWVIAVDDKGRLYGNVLGSSNIAMYDASGTYLGAIIGPGTTSTTAVSGNMIFGAGTPGGGEFLWARPLP